MWPVGAPNQTVGAYVEQRTGKRFHVRIVRSAGIGQAVKTAQLDPAILLTLEQPQQRLKFRIVNAVIAADTAEIIDHAGHRQTRHDGRHPRQFPDVLKMHQKYPPKIGNLARQRLHMGRPCRCVGQGRRPDTANAAFIQSPEFRPTDIGRYQRDTAKIFPGLGDAIEQHPVVGTIGAGLHHHGTLDTQRAQHGLEPVDPAIRRIVPARRQRLVPVHRPKNMGMGVTCPPRHQHLRLFGIQIGK